MVEFDTHIHVIFWFGLVVVGLMVGLLARWLYDGFGRDKK